MGRKYGFSFSAKRALGVSSLKNKISRTTGIPTTRQGRQRKFGRVASGGGCLVPILLVSIIFCLSLFLSCTSQLATTATFPPPEGYSSWEEYNNSHIDVTNISSTTVPSNIKSKIEYLEIVLEVRKNLVQANELILYLMKNSLSGFTEEEYQYCTRTVDSLVNGAYFTLTNVSYPPIFKEHNDKLVEAIEFTRSAVKYLKSSMEENNIDLLKVMGDENQKAFDCFIEADTMLNSLID